MVGAPDNFYRAINRRRYPPPLFPKERAVAPRHFDELGISSALLFVIGKGGNIYVKTCPVEREKDYCVREK